MDNKTYKVRTYIPTFRPQTLALQVGDTFEDLIIRSSQDILTGSYVNGHRCTLQHESARSFVGDRWLLELVGPNPAGADYLVRAISLIHSRDNLPAVCLGMNTDEILAVRKVHDLVILGQRFCAPDSLYLAGTYWQVASNTAVPIAYRRHLAHQIWPIYQDLLPANDRRLAMVDKLLTN